MLTCDTYLLPRTLDEAFDALSANRGGCRVVAGSTDLLPWAREGRADDVHVPVLVDVTRIPEMTARQRDGDRVRIGAATPMQRFLDDAMLMEALPEMPRCAVWFADDQIRESATIGGNLVNASPAADGTPPLLAHDAVVELAARRDGEVRRRRMPLSQFVLGPGNTALEEDELLVSIECDALPGWGGAFEKVGHRRSLVIAVVCLAVLVKPDETGTRFASARVAIGGIGPVPERLGEVESFLAGREMSADVIAEASLLPVEHVRSRSRVAYRREVVRGFMARGLTDAVFDAGCEISGARLFMRELR
jgi:carbon-monoxide dehydrogenase medium subunit/xanthine dehydrogenase FAD-binding subunit